MPECCTGVREGNCLYSHNKSVCCGILMVSTCCVLQDEVLIAGFGRRGHAVGDIPGVRFKVRSRRHNISACKAQCTSGALMGCSMLHVCSHNVTFTSLSHCFAAAFSAQPCARGSLFTEYVAAVCAKAEYVEGLDTELIMVAQVVKVAGVSLLALFRGKKEKPRN